MLNKKEVERQRLVALPRSKKERDLERNLLVKEIRSVLYKTKLYDWTVEDIKRELKKLTS